MRKTIGGIVVLLIAVYLLQGGTVDGLLSLVRGLLGSLVHIGADLAPKVVPSR